MVKEELIEGLRGAVAQGESLERAMASFYNAGYSKDDIEEAAVAMHTPTFFQQYPQYQQPQTQQPQPQQKQPERPVQKPQPQQRQVSYQQIPQQMMQQMQPRPLAQAYPMNVQRVSNYKGNSHTKAKILTALLVMLLFLLIGVLVTVIIFKDTLTNFFNNLLWGALF